MCSKGASIKRSSHFTGCMGAHFLKWVGLHADKRRLVDLPEQRNVLSCYEGVGAMYVMIGVLNSQS